MVDKEEHSFEGAKESTEYMISEDAKYVEYDDAEQRTVRMGTAWHHHCLSPECFMNDTGKEIILLETPQGNIYCRSTKELREELEGRAYLQAQGDFGPADHEALEMVKQFVQDGTPWHFHATPPKCILTKSNRFQLILENDAKREKKEWSFDAKPVALVRAIDDYFLGRVK